jgi:hypothetical protein
MRRRRLPKPSQLLAVLLTASLFGIFTLQPSAQTAPDTHTAHPMSFGYDKAHEITIEGTIQEVVTRHTAGSPAGLHLLVGASQGVVDAHLGQFLTKDARESLHTGTPVQIVGAMETIHGKSYLLARLLILNGQSIAVRNQRGFLLHSLGLRASAQTASNGGAQ